MTPGVITLDGEPIGTFTADGNLIMVMFNKGAADFVETLEWASEQGMSLGMMLKPDFETAQERT